MIIHTSPLPAVDIPDVPVTEHVLRHAVDTPDVVALVDGPTGRSYTYAQLAGLIASFAGGLAARGLGPGDTIALMAPNIPEYAVVFHGAAVAGVAVYVGRRRRAPMSRTLSLSGMPQKERWRSTGYSASRSVRCR